MTAPLPADEPQRLRALREYEILDTPEEPSFDRITRLVARLLKVPTALVTLVDERRQWFKSTYGFPLRETSRDESFCAYAILQEELLEVPDATDDARFAQNPLVTGVTHLRFYAGVPLQTRGGYQLGSLCAIDTRPRKLSLEEREILTDLAQVATDELELRRMVRERSQQAAAIYHLHSGVTLSDPAQPDNPITFANPGFLAMTGYEPAEILGRNCRFLQGAGTDRGTVARIREAISARQPFRGELLNYRKDGTPFWSELIVNPVFDPEGQLINFVGLQTDVTERKRIGDELRQSYEKLQALEALRDNLTNMIIHDLRSPLTTVAGFLDLLQMATASKLSDREAEFIQMAQSGALTLQEMITTLLDVHRLESGEMPLARRPEDLREVMTSATAPFRSLLGRRSLRCDLPEEPVMLPCDAALLQRVITNLVSNAIKFTPDGGEIRAVLEAASDGARISIVDRGMGIPKAYHARIFEKFGQVEGREQRHSTGLGLTFCKLVVETHGGQIGVESREGQGTTMWFWLPAQEGVGAAPAQQTAPPASQARHEAGG